MCRHFVTFSDTERITGYRQFVSSDIERITGHRHFCVSGHWTDHRTDCWIQWTNLTNISYIDRTVTRSDWFRYCVIVCTIESILVRCNHYF